MKIRTNPGLNFIGHALAAGIFLCTTSPATLRAACVSQPSGLVAWWQAEGDASDALGGNNGVLANGATFSNGEVGQSFSLDGTNSYVQIPDSPSLNLTNQFTIELWYKDTGLPGGAYGGLIGKRPSEGACNFGITIIGGNPAALLVYFADPNYGSYQALTYQGLPPAGAFHHLAVTFSQTSAEQLQIAAFIDGQSVQTASFSGNFARTLSTAPVTIGCSNPNGEFFIGNIDEVSIYNRALSSAEIASIYGAGAAGKCTTPVAPSITGQPISQSVVVGSSVAFSVAAAGSPPLTYQWSLNGVSLPGATDPRLVLSGVQLNQSGPYSVQVLNSAGSIISSNATLTVDPAPPCVVPPSGLVSWWGAEGDARDVVGGNNGQLVNGASFTQGEVGQSFSFDGVNSYVQIPDSPSLNLTAQFSIELWYKDGGLPGGAYGGLIGKRAGSGPCNFGITIIGGSPSTLLIYFADPNYGSYQALTYQGLPQGGDFHHLAVTFSQTSVEQIQVAAFVDGQSVQTASFPCNLARTLSTAPVTIGCSNPNGEFFKGNIDEVSIYNKALSGAEIASIYGAGLSGKCTTPIAPSITTQPVSQTVVAGSTVTFSVAAAGTSPLGYQWSLNGVSLPGATDARLILPNVQINQSGQYSVKVSNSVNSVFSSNAILTVNAAPTCLPPPSGLISWWAAESDAGDLVGGNNGVLANGAAFSSGEVRQSFSFDGVNSYVQIPDSPSLNLTNQFTIEFWYKDGGLPGGAYGGLIGKRPGGGACNFGITLIGGNPATLLVYFADPNYGSYQALTYQNLPPAGAFHHLAVTFSQSSAEQLQLTAFIDGQSVQTASFAGNFARTLSTAPVTLGCSNPNGEFFKGNIDEISIYNKTLYPAEIASIYNAGAGGKCNTPIAPSVSTQPVSQTVVFGSTVTFSVTAAGTSPLSYQWSLSGVNLSGATNATLVLPDVQIDQSGQYAVQVLNSAGSIMSSNATLTVNPAPPCAPPPSGLLSWWRAEGDASDAVGANGGTLANGATFTKGETGQSFNFDGMTSYVQIPDSPSLNLTNQFTIELWYKDGGGGGYSGLIGKRPSDGACNFGITIVAGNPATLLVYFADPNYGSYQALTYQGLPPAGDFHHLAVTFSQTSAEQLQLTAFIDGQSAQTASFPGNFARTLSTAPVTIGCSNPNGEFFKGNIDEVSIYNKALSPIEVASIYNAGVAGKCATPIAPSISTQPADQAVVIGFNATFSVAAAGTAPLSYQWSFNGTDIPAGTDSSFTVSHAQRSQAGNYSVKVSNTWGSVLSSNAVLVVNFPPAGVSVPDTSAIAGEAVNVPVVLAANGNENAIGFSLHFDPALVNYNGVTLGAGASGALLLVNTNQVGAGSIGIGVSLPSGNVFVAGPQELVKINVTPAVASQPFSCTIAFSDQPAKRELSDANAIVLAANFTDGELSVAPAALEADVAPRSGGDGEVTVIDWVQVGRFVAMLSSPASGAEFQRADCAPRNSLGDGLLTVSDWVQAGRYAAGIDPITAAGGPTAPNTGAVITARPQKTQGVPLTILAVRNALAFQQQPGEVTVVLEALGNENAVGFSVAFDPAVASYEDATLGADGSGATMILNPAQAGSGHLGCILALPASKTFRPGTCELIKLRFQARTAASSDSTITLTDLPVRREICDANAAGVTVDYSSGTLSVNPVPMLKTVRLDGGVGLTWPLWATNYVLQIAIGTATDGWSDLAVTPVITNDVRTVTVPVTGSSRFYRLLHEH